MSRFKDWLSLEIFKILYKYTVILCTPWGTYFAKNQIVKKKSH